MYEQLNINNYRIYFVLGNNENEKLEKREVIVNISLRFLNENLSCKSDNLKDTICYEAFLKFLELKLRELNVNLIEKAARLVYDAVGAYAGSSGVRNKIQRRIEIVKQNPLVKNLESASFVISDW